MCTRASRGACGGPAGPGCGAGAPLRGGLDPGGTASLRAPRRVWAGTVVRPCPAGVASAPGASLRRDRRPTPCPPLPAMSRLAPEATSPVPAPCARRACTSDGRQHSACQWPSDPPHCQAVRQGGATRQHAPLRERKGVCACGLNDSPHTLWQCTHAHTPDNPHARATHTHTDALLTFRTWFTTHSPALWRVPENPGLRRPTICTVHGPNSLMRGCRGAGGGGGERRPTNIQSLRICSAP
jgi:hypothetical protein